MKLVFFNSEEKVSGFGCQANQLRIVDFGFRILLKRMKETNIDQRLEELKKENLIDTLNS